MQKPDFDKVFKSQLSEKSNEEISVKDGNSKDNLSNSDEQQHQDFSFNAILLKHKINSTKILSFLQILIAFSLIPLFIHFALAPFIVVNLQALGMFFLLFAIVIFHFSFKILNQEKTNAIISFFTFLIVFAIGLYFRKLIFYTMVIAVIFSGVFVVLPIEILILSILPYIIFCVYLYFNKQSREKYKKYFIYFSLFIFFWLFLAITFTIGYLIYIMILIITFVLLIIYLRNFYKKFFIGKIDKNTIYKWTAILVGIILFSAIINGSVEDGKNKWFDEKLREYKPQKYHNMTFGAHAGELGTLTLKNKDDNNRYENIIARLNALKETNADTVRVFMRYSSYIENDKETINMTEKVIAKVRELNMKLLLCDQGDPYLIQHKTNWKQFKEIYKKYIPFFTEKFSPDYYIVVAEPTTYNTFGFLQDVPSANDWIELIQFAVNEVKNVSKNKTKTGIAVYFEGDKEREIYQKALNISNLDIIGLDIYSTDGLRIADDLLKEKSPLQYGKELWILETWYGPVGSFYQYWKGEDDAKWFKLTVYFALKWNMTGYFPFYSHNFISYEGIFPWDNVDYNQRTRTFYGYKEIIEEVRKNS